MQKNLLCFKIVCNKKNIQFLSLMKYTFFHFKILDEINVIFMTKKNDYLLMC